MINGLGQSGGLKFSMPDLSNLAMAFDFGALLAEASSRREAPQPSQRDDERDDGLGMHDGSGASDLRQDTGRDENGSRLDRSEDRHRRSNANKKSDGAERRSQEAAASERSAPKNDMQSIKRHGSVSDLSDGQRGTLGGDKMVSSLAHQMSQLRSQKGAAQQDLRMDRQGVEAMQDAEDFGNPLKGGPKLPKAGRGKTLDQFSDANGRGAGLDKQELRNALRSMNPNSMEAKLNGAKADGEKVQKLDVAQDMAAQAAIDAGTSQSQSMTQTTTEVAQTVVEAAKNVVKGSQVKAVSSSSAASNAGGLADLKSDLDGGYSRSQTAKAKTPTSDAKARFENAMRATESGDTTVKFSDAKLGNIEARISLNGQDISIRLSADDSASRQGLMDVLAEIRRELKEAQLVEGKVDVSQERERGFSDDESDHGSNTSSERETPTNEQSQTGFSLMV
jgi:hypothetical protein